MADKTILIVDDHRLMRAALSEVLAVDGYDVIEAADGAVAVECLRCNCVDLVIADIVMPGVMDGLGLISSISEQLPNLPIIAISGAGRDGPQGYLENALALGARAAVMKPFTNSEILQPVRALLAAQTPAARQAADN